MCQSQEQNAQATLAKHIFNKDIEFIKVKKDKRYIL